LDIEINDDVFAQLKVIDDLPADNGGKALKSALKYVNEANLDMLHSIAKDDKAVTELAAWISKDKVTIDELGQILGKNVNQFTDVADFKLFLSKVPLSEIADAKTLKLVMNNRAEV